jgi:hypothetical protein
VSYDVTPGPPPPTRTGFGQIFGIVGAVLGLLIAAGLAVNVAKRIQQHSVHGVAAVPNTTGSISPQTAAAIRNYYAPRGKHGLPLAVGEPWGRMCQPVRISVEEHVPNPVYKSIVAVVNQARHDGIDITMENRSFLWRPASLYYLPWFSPASVERIGIFASNAPPRLLSNGQPERLALGWDTAMQPDGQSERLLSMQGTLELAPLSGHPAALRTAIRQFIALTQGIVATDSPGSGIITGTTTDAFSQPDIAAIKAMSGCGSAAQATVAHTVTGA